MSRYIQVRTNTQNYHCHLCLEFGSAWRFLLLCLFALCTVSHSWWYETLEKKCNIGSVRARGKHSCYTKMPTRNATTVAAKEGVERQITLTKHGKNVFVLTLTGIPNKANVFDGRLVQRLIHLLDRVEEKVKGKGTVNGRRIRRKTSTIKWKGSGERDGSSEPSQSHLRSHPRAI